MGLDDREYMKKGPNLSDTKFNSSTGELELDDMPIRGVKADKPSVAMTSYELYKLNQSNKKAAKPFPAWIAWFVVVIGGSLLVSMVHDLIAG